MKVYVALCKVLKLFLWKQLWKRWKMPNFFLKKSTTQTTSKWSIKLTLERMTSNGNITQFNKQKKSSCHRQLTVKSKGVSQDTAAFSRTTRCPRLRYLRSNQVFSRVVIPYPHRTSTDSLTTWLKKLKFWKLQTPNKFKASLTARAPIINRMQRTHKKEESLSKSTLK